jgi:hypothetical protein
MSNARLVACPSCARHVRLSESSCPFCAEPLSAALRATPAPRAPKTRLSRNGLYVFGLASLSLTSGCGGKAVESDDYQEGSDAAEQPDGFLMGAAYGGFSEAGPPIEASVLDHSVPDVDATPVDATPVDGDLSGDASEGDASDGGAAESGDIDGEPSDATESDVTRIVPPYGLPPIHP